MKKKLYLFLAGLALFLIALLCFYLFGSISTGVRVGTITKLEKRGAIWATNEGELFTGGQSGSGGNDMSSGTWNFSIARGDDEIIAKIQEAMATERRVELSFREKFYKLSLLGDTPFFITDVKFVDAQKNSATNTPE